MRGGVTIVSDAYSAGESSTSPSSTRDGGFVIFYVVSTIGTFATQALAGSVVARLDWTGFYVMLALAAVFGGRGARASDAASCHRGQRE